MKETMLAACDQSQTWRGLRGAERNILRTRSTYSITLEKCEVIKRITQAEGDTAAAY